MKAKIAMFFVLFVSIPLARSAPIEGAAIQGWYYDAENHVVSLRIVNTSDVPITAFVLAVTVTDSNGPSEGDFIRDFLNHAVFIERYKGAEFGNAQKARGIPESIPSRGNYHEKIPVPQDFKDFSATLTVVAFADKTASAVSPEALQKLIDMRNANAIGIAKGIEIVNASASETEARTSIQKYRDTYDATPHTKLELDTGELLIIQTELAHMDAWKPPNGSDSDALKAYLAIKEREENIWADNAKLKLNGGAQ